ncbi:putative glycerol kinase 5 [Mus caroli]|uniref:glycerol kinase n=1 Tax=Mus caroli TaxID=10089 RepID=A0A6P5QL67_MUSCR|nr:putative glycerol kinase 5 [Mus caroli]
MSGQQERAEQQREEWSASASPPSRFVLGLDVGSTVIRCHVYDQTARVRGSSAQKVTRRGGWVSGSDCTLWFLFVFVILDSQGAAGVQMNQIVGLGISTQRATFITWNKKTGHHFHNFISWQDLRAAELVKSWNNSLIMKVLHGATRVLHFFSRSKVMLTVSRFNFSTQHATLRLTWILQNLSEVREGFYPLIGWKIGQELVCLAEGNAGDTGTAIMWAQKLDLFTDAAETEKMALSLEDSEGVYFVPSFSGLQAPLNDPCACASFMGLKHSTNKYHLVRAILESIAFRNKQLYDMLQREIQIPVTNIR